MRARALLVCSAIGAAVLLTGIGAVSAETQGSTPDSRGRIVRAALPDGAIQHVIVVDLENESFASTFGPTSPATYLNHTLVPQGELLEHYYATGHVSLDNYIAQVSGQARNPLTSSDCLSASFAGQFVDVLPGTLDPNQTRYPAQVDGSGCVYPAPSATSAGVMTIADQLDALARGDDALARGEGERHATPAWRVYAEDMGNNVTRDGGTPDPLGGTDCAHPAVGGADPTNGAVLGDQYANRHNPLIYFHSIIDDPARCNTGVVPLGTVAVGANGAPDSFRGHLAQDLARSSMTPKFSFIVPNLCNDGHDSTPCKGLNTEGTNIGGLAGADAWLEHWMPLILSSPAYRSGNTLVVVTFDEGNPVTDTTSCCSEQAGPAQASPGFSPLLPKLGITPLGPGTGGGQVGAVLLNARYIVAGTDNKTGSYNHYSALRSYEDLLGIHRGGADGYGHLGFAAQTGLVPFGPDVFNRRHFGND